MRPRLRPVLGETFRDVDYNTDSSDPTGDGDEPADGAVPLRFERGWQGFMLPNKRILTPDTYDNLHTDTITYPGRTLEKRILSYYGRVNELGGVRLERDIAGIVAGAVKGGRYEQRNLFARCVQMTIIIGMEEDE